MRLRPTLLRGSVALALLAGCGADGSTSPVLQPPAMVVAEAVAFGSSFVSAHVMNISPNYMSYGACVVYAERRVGKGWERSSIVPEPGPCLAIGHSLSQFGSTAIITVPLAASAPAGEYRLRMPFSHINDTFVSTSNVFRIE